MTEAEIANLAIDLIGGKPLTALSDNTAQAIACNRWFDQARDEALRSHPWNFARKRSRHTLTWTALSGVALAGDGSADNEIRVTATGHGLVTDDRIHLQDVEGVPGANATWFITKIDNNTFDLQESTFTGAHTSGTGEWIKAPQFRWDYIYTLPSDCLRVLRVNGEDGQENDSDPFEIEGTKLLTDADEVQLRYVFREETTTNWTADFINAFALLLASYIANSLTGTGSGKSGALRQQYEALIAPMAKSRDARETKPARRLPNYDSDLVRARQGRLPY
jgi:hypothetical protein